MDKASKRKHLFLAVVIFAALTTTYVSGYAITFWLYGRGSIGPYDAIRIEGTVYRPLLYWRLSTLPGGRLVNDFREYWLKVGMSTRREI